ncbi:MAG TPA: hypothetical protein VG713_05035 [Pirellulales bacterium]|nr:hypothetical protein [Pirellulales bacterium]
MAQTDAPTDRTPTWPRFACVLATLAIVWHLGAVLVGPISLPPSILGTALQQNVFRRYTELAFLNHAYKFFAPDPGPSHLIRYELELPDGSRKTGVFPNLQEEWPRLFYHRHFMLSERVGNGPMDPDMPLVVPEWPQRTPSQWERNLAQSYADHLLAKYNADRVTLTLVQHMLPSPEQVQQGITLDHPESYITRSLGTFVRAETL